MAIFIPGNMMTKHWICLASRFFQLLICAEYNDRPLGSFFRPFSGVITTSFILFI